MASQEQYWDQKIKKWSKVSYQKKVRGIDLVERLANLFRGSIAGRMKVALEEVGPLAKNKVVLDMGCGVGDFCFAVLDFKPKKVIGLDISSVAIKTARKTAKKKGVQRKVRFRRGNAVTMKNMPKFDIVVGLGFIDYLDHKDMRALFRLLGGRRFLFSVFEKKVSFLNLIHGLYVKWQGCPGAYKYSRKELLEIISKSSEPRLVERRGMLFITNLPKGESQDRER